MLLRMHVTEPALACLGPEGSAARVREAFAILGGRWKLEVVFRLFASDVLRFAELERSLGDVSAKVLAQQLRALEKDGVVERTVYPEIPPRVEYRLTSHGRALRPALHAVREWMRSAVVIE